MIFNYLVTLLTEIILILYMFICTISDIRTRTISIRTSAIFCMALIVFKLIGQAFSFTAMLLGAIPGICLILLGLITRQSIGYGDGIVTIVLGIAAGIERTMTSCLWAFVITAIVSCILLIMHHSKRETLPFVPFLFGAYLLNNIINLLEVI